jgi:hypothetical protein
MAQLAQPILCNKNSTFSEDLPNLPVLNGSIRDEAPMEGNSGFTIGNGAT